MISRRPGVMLLFCTCERLFFLSDKVRDRPPHHCPFGVWTQDPRTEPQHASALQALSWNDKHQKEQTRAESLPCDLIFFLSDPSGVISPPLPIASCQDTRSRNALILTGEDNRLARSTPPAVGISASERALWAGALHSCSKTEG